MMKIFLTNIFTSRDGETFSMSKLIGSSAAGSMVYSFIHAGSQDFMTFASGMSLLIAALAAKHIADGTQDKSNV